MSAHNVHNADNAPSAPSAVSRSTVQQTLDLDAIFNNWRSLAALAWEGYMTEGCGVLVVNLTGQRANVVYAGGASAHAYTHYLDAYDPRTQIVIVVRHSRGEQVYLSTGHPLPQDCYERASAAMMQATVH